MKISAVISHKGDFVATVQPGDSVSDLVEVLAKHDIGAAVVTTADGEVIGIASERDIARELKSNGASLLDNEVSTIMTEVVATCALDSSVEELMVTMTEKRVRHIPVIDEDAGTMLGIVSIGDIVRARIEHLEDEKRTLVNYITT